MGPPIEAIAEAIDTRRMRLAVFDAGLRSRTGQWHLSTTIPIEEILATFQQDSTFVDEAGRIRLPLHEADTPELTDEYVLVDPTANPTTAIFYDPQRAAPRELPLPTFEQTYPAWRVRFWTDAYPMVEQPAFIARRAADADVFATREIEQPLTGAGWESEALIDASRSALVKSRDSERARTRQAIQSMNDADVIAAHGGLSNLHPAGREIDDFGQQVITLALSADHPLAGAGQCSLAKESGLRVGDEVIVDAKDVDALPIEAELFEIGEGTLSLGMYWDSASGAHPERVFDANQSQRVMIARLVDGTRFRGIEQAIDTVESTERARDLYTGNAIIEIGEEPSEIETHLELDRYQRNAASWALSVEGVACIEAPPWTGARRTITQILSTAVDADRRVGLFTPDVAALDTLLGTDPNGTPGAISEWQENTGITIERVSRNADQVREDARVIAASISSAAAIEDFSLDLAIVDQAARIGVPAGAVPFAKARRVVCFGDPMQSIQNSPDEQLPRSIFDHLAGAYGGDCSESLRCQYRMNQAIALYPNRAFYQGRLIHGQQNRTWTIDTLAPLDAMHINGREQSTPTGSTYNEAEIQAVIEEVRSLLERGVEPGRIGVLTPTSAQIGKVRVALADEQEGLDDALLVGDLETFRCQSRDVIIISCVHTDATSLQEGSNHPFWTDRGLATALTRAARRLVIIGDWQMIADRAEVNGEDDAFAQFSTFLTERGLLTIE